MGPRYYAEPTKLTMFTAERAEVVRALDGGPEAFCRVVQGLVALPPEAVPSVADAHASPYTLVGTVTDIAAKVEAIRERWGISRYTVRSLEPIAELITALDPR